MNEADFQAENPYAPPQADAAFVPAYLLWNPGLELQSRRVPRSERFKNRLIRFLRFNPIEDLYVRRLQFWGEFVGVVEWKAGLDEWVAVNDVVYCRYRNLGMNLIPRFEIPVHAGRPAILVVEVRSHNWCSFWPVIDAFRIRLDDRTLYSEGEWPDHRDADRDEKSLVAGVGASPSGEGGRVRRISDVGRVQGRFCMG